jgi:hypothetical protein
MMRVSNLRQRMAGTVIGLVSAVLLTSAATGEARTRIDVLVVYTPAVERQYGGVAGVRALALASVNGTNKSFDISRIPLIFRLVGVRKANYVESDDMREDLGRLTDPNDGFMDEVHDWRDRVGADLVHLLRRGSTAGVAGIAWLSIGGTEAAPTGNPDFGFAVTADNAAVGNSTFAHEAGHNLGAFHNRTGPGAIRGRPVVPYSYGHRFTAGGKQYRTIMAYAPGDRLIGSVARWSNPRVRFLNVPTGAENSADNARAFAITGPVVADYRTGSSGPQGDLAIVGTLDFRNIRPGFAARRTILLVNRSREEDAEVRSLKLPRGLSVNWRGGVIAAGRRQPVTITYRPPRAGLTSRGKLEVGGWNGALLAERPFVATSAAPRPRQVPQRRR